MIPGSENEQTFFLPHFRANQQVFSTQHDDKELRVLFQVTSLIAEEEALRTCYFASAEEELYMLYDT